MQTKVQDKENIIQTLHKTAVGTYGFLLVFFVGLVTIIALLTWHTTSDYPYRDHVDYSEGWTDADGNSVDIGDVDTTADLYRELPLTTETYTLFLSVKTANVSVFVDDEQLYETELYETWFLGTTPGYLFAEVKIPAGEAGRVLNVKIDNPYGDTSSRIDDIYFGDGASIVSHKTGQLLTSFSLGVLMMVIGALFVIFSFIMRKRFGNAARWVYIGLFAIITGIFIMMDSKLLYLIYGHSAIWHITVEISLMMIPVPFFLYFVEEFKLSKRLYPLIIMGVGLTEVIVNLLLNLLNIKEYHETVVATHCVFALIIVVGVHIVGSAMVKDIKNHIYDFLGLVVIGVGGITDVVLYYTKSVSQTYIFLRIGVFGFIILSCMQVVISILYEYEDTVRGDVVRNLAYHDGLTGLLNRTSFIEEMESIDKKNGSCVLLAMFDVNNLKAVNDTLGHAAGDNLILSEARALSAGFSEVGKVFRIGGDEFVVIITGDLIRDKFENGLKTYEEKIREMNASQGAFAISAAVGVDSNVISDSCTSQDILKKADAAMYENKKEMKQMRKS